jgi:hypothetical protein
MPSGGSFVNAEFRSGAMSTWPTRPATDLLAVPFALTQTGVLTASALVREAEVRGWKLTVESLDVLADVGLFVPLFELIDEVQDDLIVDPTAGTCEWPFEAHAQAMAVRDPVGGRFDRTRLDACRYSHWQLLWFHGVGWDQLHPKTEEALRDITNDDMLRPWFEQAAGSYRQLAIVLEVVAASFMPFVSNRVSRRGHHMWSPANTKDSGSVHDWLSVAADLVHGQAEMLLLAARNVDPLAEWSPLTGHASSEARHKLKGGALVAVDLREAAELLLQLYDDLPNAQLSTELPSRIGTYWQPLHERLKRPRAERDRILNDLGLTPFPSLIVAVEGHTEEAIIAKALDAFGWRVGLDAIEVVNLRGVGNDVSVLARYAGAPRLAEELGDLVLLRRPLAHLAVLADPKGPYTTVNDRAAMKVRLVDDLVQSLPERLRTPKMIEDMSNLVTVDTWGGLGGPYEFAHFTDEELADAVVELCPGVDRDRLVRGLCGQRVSGSPDVDKVLDSGVLRGHRRPSKIDLALHMWPRLQGAIEEAVSSDEPSPVPLARMCQELMQHLNRVSFVKALRY